MNRLISLATIFRQTCRWFTSTTARMLVLALLFSLSGSVHGQSQRAAPRIGFAYPAGGQQGTKFTVVVSGQNLAGATTVYFTGSGVQGTVTGYERPLNPKELNALREQLEQLQHKRAALRAEKSARSNTSPTALQWTGADEKQFADIKRQLATRPNRQANPALSETVTLEVTLAPDAPPGDRELRLKTPAGLSNPLVFCAGQLPEFTSPAVVVTSPLEPSAKPFAKTPAPPAASALAVTLPTIINGQILPGEVDRYRFSARQGQRIVVAVSARALIPYLADAVPGWFQSIIALYDSAGRELAYDADFRFNPDPVLAYPIREDGEYTIAIHDSIYRGREDFVYRISVGELPFVTSLFPLGGSAGTITTVEVEGWNLSANKMTVDARSSNSGDFLLSVRHDQQVSNSVRFVLDDQPEVQAIEPNDHAETAQPLTLPTIVNGRIEHQDDTDVFSFHGRAGEEIVAEVFARRLKSPLDSVLQLTDATGQVVAMNDDYDDKSAALITHQADSRISVLLPSSGRYQLRVGDTQHHGGPEFSYRLYVGPPRPDFELRVTPSSLNVKAGASVVLTAFALRHDGFNGEIALDLLGEAAKEFALSGARIPAGADRVRLTLTARAKPRDEPYPLQLGGRVVIGHQTITHPATPAEDMMQAFAYRHLVSAQALQANVSSGRWTGFRLLSPLPLPIPASGTVHLRVAIPPPAKNRDITLRLELSDPPEGLELTSFTPGNDTVDIVLTSDGTKTQPGQQGNLIIQAYGQREGGAQTGQPPKNQRIPLGPLPAVPFQIFASPTRPTALP